jgi:uncharacterized membrane protein
MKEHDTPEKNYDLERLLFFSDGVFAIAITLLAIELHPPHGWDGHFETLFNATAGLLIFYAISFFAIAMFWMAHRGVFRHVIKFNEVASLLNILFLMFICLVPFANSLFGEGHLSIDVIVIYVGLMSVTSFLLGLLWAYLAFIAKVTDPRLSTQFKWFALLRLSLFPPVMSGAALWISFNYGLWPCLAFLIPAAILSIKLRSKVYKDEVETALAPKASDEPQ